MITIHLEGPEEAAEWRMQPIDVEECSIRFIIRRQDYPSIYFRVVCAQRERHILKELVEMTLRARGDCYHTCLVQIGITSYMCLVTETEKMEGLLEMAVHGSWYGDIVVD